MDQPTIKESAEVKKVEVDIPLDSKPTMTTEITPDQPLKKSTKMMKRLIALIIVLLVIIPVATFLIGLYVFHWEGKVVDSITKVIPFPVATVNGHWINYAEWRDGVATVNHFYAQKDSLGVQDAAPTLTQPQIESNELDRLVQRELLNELADQYDMSVSQEEIEQEYKTSILPQATDEAEVTKTIETLYGWTLDQFKQQVVKEVVLRHKLQAAMNADVTLNAAAKTKIDAAKAELDAGTAFADVAKKYSDDSSAADGGDLGFITKGQTVPEFETVAFATETGKISDIFTSTYGYHILEVIEAQTDKVHVAHILGKFISIDEQLASMKKSAVTHKFVAVVDQENINAALAGQ